jgi:hypothetical protein
MYGDVVGQRGKWMHFFQRGLHHNKALKWLYYAFGPYCLDVCAKNLWPRELSFLLSYVWLEWTIIVIWGWCIAFMWHCIIGLASCWFINACRKLVASWKPILYFGFYSTYHNNQWKCTPLTTCFFSMVGSLYGSHISQILWLSNNL